MTYRHLVARLLLALCFVAGTAVAVAQPITAPLDGIEYFTEHGTRNLKVTNPEERCLRIEKREDFQILQGDDNTRRDINLAASNLNPHQVANIDIPEPGSLLYRVGGVYCHKKKGSKAAQPAKNGPPAGQAEKPEDWTATYDRGKARILLEINGPGEIDNKVRLNESDSQLSIRIAGNAETRDYEVTLTPLGKGVSPGMVALTTPVTVPGPAGVRTIPLKGLASGEFTITGTADGLDPGSVDGEVIAYTVEILVNNSSTKDDDYVQIQSKFPPKRFETPCQARLVGTLPAEDQSIVIVNPDKRVRFPKAETVPLTLPKDGTPRHFVISGESESQAVEDVELIAKQGSAQGAQVGKESATVFWFDAANISVTRPPNFGAYGFLDDRYTVLEIPPAVVFRSSALLRPQGLNCDAPQISPLRVGFMQEVLSSRSTTTWDKPFVGWDPFIASGTKLPPIPLSYTQVRTFDDGVTLPVNDGGEGAHPLYNKAGTSLAIPSPCSADAEANDGDTPSHTAASSIVREFRTTDGRMAALVTWFRRNATKQHSYRTYCVIYNNSTQEFTALRETTWSLDLDHVAGKRFATVPNNMDDAASRTPSTGPQANTLLRNKPISQTPDSPLETFEKP